MNKKIIGFLVSTLLITTILPITVSSDYSSKNIIYVDDDNIEGPWDGTQEHPYQYIQDAIDNASDGDTVFVYSGTYVVETFIEINKSIELRGQSTDNTIVKAPVDSLLFINKSNVSVSYFTFENLMITLVPFEIEEFIIIEPPISKLYNIEISNNRIKNSICLLITEGINVKVSGNIFSPKKANLTIGIVSINNTNVEIENNEVSGFMVGLAISEGNVVKNNLIQKNVIGLEPVVFGGSLYPCVISENNFIQNYIHSFFALMYSSKKSKYFSLLGENNLIKNYMSKDIFNPTSKNLLTNIKWDGNYWDNWIGFGPKFIFGNIFPRFPFFPFLSMINFDWHPAKEPYDFYEPESAFVTVSGTNNRIKILLSKGGDNAPYANVTGDMGFDIFINGTKLSHGNFDIGSSWEVGESIILTTNEKYDELQVATKYAVTVQIMGTVIYDSYIYVSNPSGEGAGVTVSGINARIKILLTKGGDNAPYANVTGKNGFDIFINGTKLAHSNYGVGSEWEVGESIILTKNEATAALVPGVEYLVTVWIMGATIYDSYITVLS